MSPSTRRFVVLSVAVVATLASAAGSAATDDVKAARHTEQLQALQTELIARGDADALSASALFERELSGKDSRKALDLAARAVAAAPDRADLLLEQIELCQQVPSCNSEPLEALLRQQDPENGISWAYALMRAAGAGDADAMRRGRAGLAKSRRVSLYWNKTVSRMTAAVTGRAGFDSNMAMIEIIGIEAALPAAIQPVSRACSAQEVQQPDVMAQCRQIAAAFRDADTWLFASYGTSLAARLWPDGSVERIQSSAARRVLHYQMGLMVRYARRIDAAAAAGVLATLYAQYPTEQQAFRALYVRLGLDPDPPENWQDPSPAGHLGGG